MLAIRKYCLFKVLIVGLLSLGFSTIALAKNHDPLKVAFVYVGPTGDAGWTYAHDEARKYMVEQLGEKVKTPMLKMWQRVLMQSGSLLSWLEREIS